MRVYALATCDTCRKALKALRESGHAPTVIDVRKDGLDADVIAEAVARFGPATINRASTTWRGLDDETRALPPATLLARHPLLLKRPLVIDGDTWTIGWKADAQAAHLGG